MSEFFLYEIENIAKSGVEIKVTGTRLKKCDDDCIRTVRTVCFDFSEHDKVFEDKISQLEKDIASYKQAFEDKCADYGFISELLGKYQQENESLKQRISELEQSRSEWADKAVEWQQKCEKLESKESVKPMRIEFHADNGEMLTPLEVANSLINQNTFKIDELKELAEILEVYHRHHRDKDKDTDDLW